MGDGFRAYGLVAKTFDVCGRDPGGSLYVGVDFRASSIFAYGIQQNAYIEVKDDDGSTVYSKTLFEGDSADSGWRSFSHDIAQLVGDDSSVTVELSMKCEDNGLFEQRAYFENFCLGYADPLLSKEVTGGSSPLELPGSDREETQDAQRLGELLGKDSEDLTHEERFLPADVCGMRLR